MADETQPLRIGISSCLLGRAVRYDGGHKHDRYLTDVVGPFVEWVPVCPEVEVGMGIPRESVRLVRVGGAVRLIAERSGTDHTSTMQAWARQRVRQLAQLDLCGYVLKKNSPSCGMERVRIYSDRGMPTRNGRGLFAEALLAHLSALPVEEEGRLNAPALRENFLERVFAYRRLRDLFATRWRARDIIAFHAAHKLQLMAHSPAAYRDLGRLVAGVAELSRHEFRERYEIGFMTALAQRATVPRHVNVLQHMTGYLRKPLDDAARAELQQLIADYRAGLLPLIVPITLIGHHARHHEIGYLVGQSYLAPHPKELMLRNHV